MRNDIIMWVRLGPRPILALRIRPSICICATRENAGKQDSNLNSMFQLKDTPPREG